jgi:curved DNA-binding protein CbpA
LSATADHYKTLQVDPDAEPEVIQAAYRRLAQKYHPDVAADPVVAARMAAINEAWAVLRDVEARARYDAERRAGSGALRPDPGLRRPASARSTSPGAPGAPGTAASPSSQSAGAPPDETNPFWTPGRSTTGGGYDPTTMGRSQGHGAAGPPPSGPTEGTVLNFGRYAGWSLGQIARRDIEYLEWLDRMPIGRPHRDEIDQLLRQAGRRRSATREPERRGLFRRR